MGGHLHLIWVLWELSSKLLGAGGQLAFDVVIFEVLSGVHCVVCRHVVRSKAVASPFF